MANSCPPVVDDAEVEIAVFGQPERGPFVLVDLLKYADVACGFGDGLGELGQDGGVAVGVLV